MKSAMCVIGTGYVGLCTGVGFAEKGFKVICVGRTKEKIERINKGDPIIYEPVLEDSLKKVIKNGLFQATIDLKYAIENSNISFICVGTPSKHDGSIDLGDIRKAAEDIGKFMKTKKDYHIVVVKSTVVPETTDKIVIPSLEKTSGKKTGRDFGVCMNPEFLREGMALKDFLEPDRIVIGEYNKKSGDILENIYKIFNAPILRTNLKVAETIKYANNAFLATKISFANEIGNICKKLGIDTYDVFRGVGMDHRISPHFFNAGAGWGGSCFPKDVSALIAKSKELGYEPKLLEEVRELNKRQKVRIVEQLESKLGSLKDKKIALLGLSFKPNTDDIREASSIAIIEALKRKGAAIIAYDPQAIENMKQLFPDLIYTKTAQEALKGVDASVIITEWEEFKQLNENDFGLMKNRLIFEGRKVLDPNQIKDFEGICW